MADGFLGRWSQRKQAVRAGQPVADTVSSSKTAVAQLNQAQAATVFTPKSPSSEALTSAPDTPDPNPQLTPAEATPAPTLEDVHALRPSDSFARFVAPDVPPQVRNAAMKKLFADPHYNVMDGLDIYIDDYAIANPLPAATLRQMASAKFLNLFDEQPAQAQGAAPAALGEDAHTAPAPSVAQSAQGSELPDTPAPLPCEPVAHSATANPQDSISHDHPDLRLQPDHAAGSPRLEREPERTPDAAQQPVPTRSG